MSDDICESQEQTVTLQWPRKRKIKQKKENIIRDAEVRGVEHVNHVRKLELAKLLVTTAGKNMF